MRRCRTSAVGCSAPLVGHRGVRCSLGSGRRRRATRSPAARARHVAARDRLAGHGERPGRFADLAITVNQTDEPDQPGRLDHLDRRRRRPSPGPGGSAPTTCRSCSAGATTTARSRATPAHRPSSASRARSAARTAAAGVHAIPIRFALSRIIASGRLAELRSRPTASSTPVAASCGGRSAPSTAPSSTSRPTRRSTRHVRAATSGSTRTSTRSPPTRSPAAATGPDGKGAELLEVHTGLRVVRPRCGQKVQPIADGTKVPQCWIVVVPRGSRPSRTWAHRSPMLGPPQRRRSRHRCRRKRGRTASPSRSSFNPVDSPCSLADEPSAGSSGSELVLPAVASWQPALCAGAGLPPYSYAPVGDAPARQQLASPRPAAPGWSWCRGRSIATAIDPTEPGGLRADQRVRAGDRLQHRTQPESELLRRSATSPACASPS